VDELTREQLISTILEMRERIAELEAENAELRARLGDGGEVCAGSATFRSWTSAGEVMGNCRFGIKVMSLIAEMAISCRMPHRTIQRMLGGLYGLRISVGGKTASMVTYGASQLRMFVRPLRDPSLAGPSGDGYAW